MIPIQLTLQGVYSYQEKQVIDFESLTQAGLFGIFGKVGSGKSSIVEAITYVLYGETNRMNGRESLQYNMTNLRSTTFWIDYVFRINATKYKFEAKGKRNSKNFSDIKISRAAYIWDEKANDWLPIENDATPILGLKYNDFRRAVIVPQGNFQEFLELKGTDRSVMMQDLFGLDKFDLSANVSTLKAANELAIHSIEEKITNLGEVTEEVIAAMELELTVLEKENDLRQKSLTSIRAQTELLQQLKLQIETAITKKNILQQFENQSLAFQQRKEQLKQYQSVLAYVKPAILQLENALKEQQNAFANLAEAEKKEQEISVKKNTALAQETALKTQYTERDNLKIEAEDWRNILIVKDLNKSIQDENVLLLNSEKENIQYSDTIANLKMQRQTAQALLAKLTTEQIDIIAVSEVLAWFSTLENLQAQRSAFQKEANEIVTKENKSLTQKMMLLEAQQLNSHDDSLTLEDIENKIENTASELKKQSEKLEEHRLNLLQQQALQTHVHALKDGLPCPLCGAVHHLKPLSADEDLKTALKRLEAETKLQKLEEQSLYQQKEQLIEMKTLTQFIENEKNRIKMAFEENRMVIEQHKAAFRWNGFSSEDKETIKAAQSNFNQNEKEKQRIQSQLADIQQNIEQKELLFQSRIDIIQKSKESLAAKNATLDAALKTLKKLSFAAAEHHTEKDILAKATHLEQQFESIEKEYQKAKEILQDIENQAIKSKSDLAHLNVFLANANKKQQEMTLLLQSAVASSGFTSLEQVQGILQKNIDVEKEENAITNFTTELSLAQHNAATAAALVKDKNYDSEGHQQLINEMQMVENQINTANQTIGIQKNNIKKAKEDKEKQAVLVAERTTLKDRAANIATLESLFKAKGFVNYVSRVYLENVVGIANTRFQRMTQQQLKLQLAEDNAFEVLDILNDGRTRSVKTLSGGQKFQASLCLALALADSISSASRENFFFLDEGFGSLDKKSLQIVFETLQSLRKENRVVGIISHVEEMQQEIERYIHVALDENMGTVVEVI